MKNNIITPLFVCLANVGRSQMAQGMYTHIYGEGTAMSCAGGQARKEKYSGCPADGIVSLMREYGGIDVSKQRIKYLVDIEDEDINRIDRVVFLYDPTEDRECDKACQYGGLTPHVYLQDRGFQIDIHNIPDPFIEDTERWRSIYEQIQQVVTEIR